MFVLNCVNTVNFLGKMFGVSEKCLYLCVKFFMVLDLR